MVPPSGPFCRRRGTAGVSLQPLFDDIVIELFGPKQPGEALPHHALCVRRQIPWDNRRVEIIRFTFTGGKHAIESAEGGSWLVRELDIRETQPDTHSLSSGDVHYVMSSRLGADGFSRNRLFCPVYDVVVDSVFLAQSALGRVEEPLSVGFVFGEQELRRTVVVQPTLPAGRMVQFDCARHPTQVRTSLGAVPRPGVAEPDGRKQP